MATIRKRDGKYQAQVRRQGYAPVSKTFTRQADAREWARLQETRADRHELAPDKSILQRTTLEELVIRYRDTAVTSLKGSARETITLNAFLRQPMCRKTLAELNTADFAKYRDEQLKSVTAKSLKRMLSPINRMFRLASEEWGYPLINPLAELHLKATDNKRQRRLQRGELDRLFEAAKRTRNPYTILVVQFALETAMRRGEILALEWPHVDLTRCSVTIIESKNGHARALPLTPSAISVLVQTKHISSEENRRIFPVSANGFRLSWTRLVKRAAITDLHFHDLRHEAISRFFELGLTVPEVASISGHRDMRMLLRYAHANQTLLREKLRLGDRSKTSG